MKRTAIDHPKLLRLMSALEIPRYQAVGILESVWHFTAKFARLGNIGKFPDGEIAIWIGWQDDAKKLVSAMVSSGWLDECKKHRLLVHDWQEHADQATKKAVSRHSETFAEHVPICPDMSRHVETSTDMSSLPEPEPEPEPEPRIRARIVSARLSDDQWTKIWKAYPRKIGKAEAHDQCKKIVREGVASPDELLAAVKNYAAYVNGSDYIQHACTFFRPSKRRWEDFKDGVPGAAGGKAPASYKIGQFHPGLGRHISNEKDLEFIRKGKV